MELNLEKSLEYKGEEVKQNQAMIGWKSNNKNKIKSLSSLSTSSNWSTSVSNEHKHNCALLSILFYVSLVIVVVSLATLSLWLLLDCKQPTAAVNVKEQIVENNSNEATAQAIASKQTLAFKPLQADEDEEQQEQQHALTADQVRLGSSQVQLSSNSNSSSRATNRMVINEVVEFFAPPKRNLDVIDTAQLSRQQQQPISEPLLANTKAANANNNNNNKGQEVAPLTASDRLMVEVDKQQQQVRESATSQALALRRNKRLAQRDSDRLQIRRRKKRSESNEISDMELNSETKASNSININSSSDNDNNLTRARVIEAEEAQSFGEKKAPAAVELTLNNMTATTTTTTTAAKEQQTNANASLKCRIEKNLYLDFEEYKDYTCAMCYSHIKPEALFHRKLKYVKPKYLYDDQLDRSLLPNETELIKPTFKDESNYYKWLDCCHHAIDCCADNQIYLPKPTKLANGSLVLVDEQPSDTCPATWDGLSCWPKSPIGQIAVHPCPNHVYFLEFQPGCSGQVKKQCFSNGSWFIKNDHEWSDFSSCTPVRVYATQMLISGLWHFFAAIIMTPALIALHHFPNRAGSKRIRILIYLLYSIMCTSIFTGGQKIGIMSGLFYHQQTEEAQLTRLYASSGSSNSLYYTTSSNNTNNSIQSQELLVLIPTTTQLPPTLQQAQRSRRQIAQLNGLRNEQSLKSFLSSDSQHHKVRDSSTTLNSHSDSILLVERVEISPLQHDNDAQVFVDTPKVPTHSGAFKTMSNTGLHPNDSLLEEVQFTSSLEKDKARVSTQQITANLVTSRQKRNIANTNTSKLTPKSHPLTIVLCWFANVGIKISRLFVYSWMFTGGIYLCSVLHYAPAEPPSKFTKLLMLLTNGFPIVTAITYLTLRTYYEASPINLLYLLPYYYYQHDNEAIKDAMAYHLNCWFNNPKLNFIEEIAILPNLVFVILNTCLFIVTLIIMCRITRPGSTRADMSLGNYFKAAGTLVVLYGAHYALLAHRPDLESMGCVKGQMLYYLIQFVDGYQGIAVSYVFCYRTPEGKEIIGRWWKSVKDAMPEWLCLNHRENNPARERNLLNASNRSNQSTRSNNSICNGKDVTTELIDINDTQVTNRFNT